MVIPISTRAVKLLEEALDEGDARSPITREDEARRGDNT